MSDGSLNYLPEDAVKAIFGDTEARKRSDKAQVIAALVLGRAESGDWPDPEVLFALPGDEGYNQCALWVAALILRFARAYGEPWFLQQDEDKIYRIMKTITEYAESLESLGLSGFQWGWAVNTAKRIAELPPGPNPAIVDIG